MLKCATNQENETLDRLTFLFRGRGILFTLVGGAACREYGLRRPTKDLDFVAKPYPLAMDILSTSGAFNLVVDDCPDVTGRTCTRKDAKTGVLVDFLTGGIRITDHALLGTFRSSASLSCSKVFGLMYAFPLLSVSHIGNLYPGGRLLCAITNEMSTGFAVENRAYGIERSAGSALNCVDE